MLLELYIYIAVLAAAGIVVFIYKRRRVLFDEAGEKKFRGPFTERNLNAEPYSCEQLYSYLRKKNYRRSQTKFK